MVTVVEGRRTRGSARSPFGSPSPTHCCPTCGLNADILCLKQALFLKVTEVVCEAPSPRASSTLIGSPSNPNELFLFGGEYFDGALATFYNDLFVYLIDRDEWRRVTSPNSPLPRSGHAWCRGGNSGGVYLFGGNSISLNYYAAC